MLETSPFLSPLSGPSFKASQEGLVHVRESIEKASVYTRDGSVYESATGLLAPPRIGALKRAGYTNPADTTLNVSNMGVIMHQGMTSSLRFSLAHLPKDSYVIEERFHGKFAGETIGGQPDLMLKVKGGWEIWDWKFTTATQRAKDDWHGQLNIYARIMEQYGRKIVGANILAVFRDWRDVRHAHKYDSPFTVFNIPLTWGNNDVEELVVIHKKADEELPPCTPEDKWERPTRFALMKSGSSRAKKLYDTLEEAQLALGNSAADYRIEERGGEPIRCDRYCPVSKHCNQLRGI